MSSESDDEETQLAKAIQMSLDEQSAISPPRPKSSCTVPDKDLKINDGSTHLSALAGIDRKAMERERLARARQHMQNQNKRPIEVSNEAGTEDAQQADKKRHRRDIIVLDGDNVPLTSNEANATKPALETFAPGSIIHGAVKQTWVYGCERSSTDVKLEEILQAKNLKTAVFSTFQLDYEWLHSKLQAQTKRMIIMGVKDEAAREQWREDVKPYAKLIDLRFPDMSGQINCMHSKLMVLFYESCARVVIPTANLMKYDWGEALDAGGPGVMENTVFLIDLPRLEAPTHSVDKLNTFGQDLYYYLEAVEAPNVAQALLQFDFSKTDQIALIHTMGGAHMGADAAQRTGFPGLSAAIRKLQLQSNNELQLDISTASLGSLDYQMLSSLYLAAMGQRPKAGRGIEKVPEEHLRSHIRVYFPTKETVMNSKGGTNGAGTITLPRKFYTDKFPKDCLRDHRSTREKILSHSKLIYARGKHDGRPIGWMYIGSANLSESAWGKLVVDRATKHEKLNCRNWECGILLPLLKRTDKKLADRKADDVSPFEAFSELHSPPFKTVNVEYGDAQPWFFQDFHRPDAHQ